MAYHWIPPPQGTLKINVYAISGPNPARFKNETGMGAVYRDSGGKFRHLTDGVIPRLTPLGAQLWIIFIVLKRAFLEGYRDVIVETDNLPAYLAIKNFILELKLKFLISSLRWISASVILVGSVCSPLSFRQGTE